MEPLICSIRISASLHLGKDLSALQPQNLIFISISISTCQHCQQVSAKMRCPVSDGDGSSASSMPNGIDISKMEEIPEPPMHYFGLLGHIPDIDSNFPLRTFWNMMDLYGPIFKMKLGGTRIVIGNQELANEVFDQDRFKKVSESRTRTFPVDLTHKLGPRSLLLVNIAKLGLQRIRNLDLRRHRLLNFDGLVLYYSFTQNTRR